MEELQPSEFIDAINQTARSLLGEALSTAMLR